MTTTIYNRLPAEIRKEIQENLKNNQDLKIGFFSDDFKFVHEGKEISYRFRAKEVNGQKNFSIIFNSNVSKHNPYIKNNHILFYDKKLKNTLHLKKELFDEILDSQIDFNLSTEQKELLSTGHDITLNVTNTSLANKGKNVKLQKSAKTELKSYVADYSFFLGKCSLILKENPSKKTTKSLGLTKN